VLAGCGRAGTSCSRAWLRSLGQACWLSEGGVREERLKSVGRCGCRAGRTGRFYCAENGSRSASRRRECVMRTTVNERDPDRKQGNKKKDGKETREVELL
jgi:hypothetical protein